MHRESTRGNDLPAMRRAYPCARPARAAASSCRIFALHRCPGAPVRTTLRPLNDPSESPPSPSGNSGCAPSAQPAELLPCSLTPTTVGQHGGKSPKEIHHVLTDHMGAACPESACRFNISLTILSIVKLQKIVNPIKEFNLKKCKAYDNIRNMYVI